MSYPTAPGPSAAEAPAGATPQVAAAAGPG